MDTRRLARLVALYAVWCVTHAAAAQLYSSFCAPATVGGVVTAFLSVPAPHCASLRWYIGHGAENIASIWTRLPGLLSAYALM